MNSALFMKRKPKFVMFNPKDHPSKKYSISPGLKLGSIEIPQRKL
jgi:hypothetical protein